MVAARPAHGKSPRFGCDLEDMALVPEAVVVATCIASKPMTAAWTRSLLARTSFLEVGADQRAPSQVPLQPIPTLLRPFSFALHPRLQHLLSLASQPRL
jgi:hypothetical protein